jgi:tRNA wybutosine-synthesizing protein 3
MEQFVLNKKNALSKLDKSKKGEVDVDIVTLLDFINSLDDFFTTSSCSGRVVLLECGESKNDNNWLYCDHANADLSAIKKALESYSGQNDIWLRAEPFIMHVCAKSLEKADQLLQLFRENGFKHSGVIVMKNKIVLEIQNTDAFSTIVSKEGIVLANDLQVLITEANKKLSSTKNKLKRIEKLLLVNYSSCCYECK